MVAALVAAALVAIGQVAGWRGVDVAAAVARVDNFRTSGFSAWDSRWYGGHFTLDYSIIYPPLASGLGIPALAVASAALATLAFHRTVRPQFGGAGTAGALVFAAGTLVQSSIGQLPFLTGEAFALTACWCASRRRWAAAAVLALAASSSSPLAGTFLGMSVAAWALSARQGPGRWGRAGRAAGVIAAAGVPVLATVVWFPGTGPMPYPAVDFVFEVAVAGCFWVVGRMRRLTVVEWMSAVFVATAVFAETVPTSLGGNVGRMEDAVALPVAVMLLWSGRKVLIVVLAWPLALSQWSPAWGALTSAPSQPSTHRAFFDPLDAALQRLSAASAATRVEVVPTGYHWEAAYVPLVMPLARGWERQLDTADNPLFYRSGPLGAAAYREWLIGNGVGFVALANAPLDPYSGPEAALIDSGRAAGLTLVWESADWRLYRVAGHPTIAAGPAELLGSSNDRVAVYAPRPGPVLIRIRANRYWNLTSGAGCVDSTSPTARADRPWITVEVPAAEHFTLGFSLFGRSTACPGA